MTKEKHKSVRCDIRDARERHGHESGALVLLQDDLGLYRYLSTFPQRAKDSRAVQREYLVLSR